MSLKKEITFAHSPKSSMLAMAAVAAAASAAEVVVSQRAPLMARFQEM